MELVENMGLGLAVATTLPNLLACFIGVLMGTLVGVLPGLGPAATIAILLPITFGMDPTSAMIMLAGVYYGAKYGGALTAILINTPGESSSVMTCLDGYKLATDGKAGKALGIAAISSFFGGTAGVIGLMLLAPVLADFAVSFGPPEYFALMMLGFVTVIFLGGGSATKAMVACAFGLLLGTVGTDPLYGMPRLTFGEARLLDGVDFVVVAMGLFAVSEVLVNAESKLQTISHSLKLQGLFPSLADIRQCVPTFLRATGLGFFIGVMPGAGTTIASLLAYSVEKAVSKKREEFGHGSLNGVAAPETADNAASVGALVPLLTLGIPGSGSTAILIGAMMIYGVRPGPLLFEQNPQFVWGIIASMYIGNVMLVILNLPLVPLFALILRVRYAFLYPVILMVCIIGAYSLNGSLFDVATVLVFGAIGYIMRKYAYPPAPVVLGLVLGPLIERAFSQSLAMSQGDISILYTRAISGTLLAISALCVVGPMLYRWFWRRQVAKRKAASDPSLAIRRRGG